MRPPNTSASEATGGNVSFVPAEPNRPPGIPKNHAPGRWVSNDWPPSTAPTTIAAVPTKPRNAVRATPRRTGMCGGAPDAAVSGGASVSVGALGVTSSIGGFLT